MVVASRIAVGLLGAAFIALALALWFDTDAMAARLGLEAPTLGGQATVRADVAGFFLTGGGFALFAAIEARASWLVPVIALLAAALLGRVLTLILSGVDATSFPPMVIEALAIALMLWCLRAWPIRS